MRSRFLILLAALSAPVAPMAAHAQWKGKAEAGVVMARGNSESTTANGKLDMALEKEKWKHSAYLAAVFAQSENAVTERLETDTERYEARWQSDYNFSKRSYWFGGLRYDRDLFSGFDYQASITTGYGYRFIDTDRTKFYGQAGVGYRKLRDAVTDIESDDIIFQGMLGFEYQITPNTKLTDKVIVEAGEENTFISNDLALEVKMSERFGLSVGYSVRNNSDPPPGLESTDTLTTVNLTYTF